MGVYYLGMVIPKAISRIPIKQHNRSPCVLDFTDTNGTDFLPQRCFTTPAGHAAASTHLFGRAVLSGSNIVS